MSSLLALPVGLPLVVAAFTVLVRNQSARRAASFAGSSAFLGVALHLVVATSDGSTVVAQMGAWPAPFAIAFAADAFSSLMLSVAGVMLLVCSAFAWARREDEGPYFHALVMVLAAGVAGSFLTADIFNLFVFFEVMLIASYVLLSLGGSGARVRGGAVYVTTNLLASTILIAGIALIYGAVGSVNMAELGEIAQGSTVVAVAAAPLLVAFAVKASLVPLHGWIGVAYPVAPPAVAALLAGLLTKVGVYAIYRVYAVIFQGDPAFQGALLVVAVVTMVFGVLAAVGQDDMRSILSFHITSQVGYMILGLALFSELAIAAGIFFILHNIVVKTSLFLAAGAVETLEGSGRLADLGGVARRRTVLGAAFMVSALALVGLPPLSGFYPKLGLVRAAFDQAHYLSGAAAVAVSFFTLVSMAKIWHGAFWGSDGWSGATPSDGALGGGGPDDRVVNVSRRAVVAPTVALALLAVLIGVGAQGMLDLSLRAAEGLIDTSRYTAAVLGR